MAKLYHSIEVITDDHITIKIGLDNVTESLDIYGVEKSKDEDYQELEVCSTYDPSIPKWQGVNQYPFIQTMIICGAFEHFVLTGYERTKELLTIWGYLEPSYYPDRKKANSHIPYDNSKQKMWVSKEINHKVGCTADKMLQGQKNNVKPLRIK